MKPESSRNHLNALRQKLRERPMRKDLEPVRRKAQGLMDDHEPSNRPSVIQVVGSNGKGSVVHYLGELLRAESTVVSFTSPHLVHPGERIQLDGEVLTPTELNDSLATLGPNPLEDYTPFEALFLVGLRTSLDANSDYLLLEAGMGGRWDATSAIKPEWVILTSVDLEHTEYLGSTRHEILREKLAQLPDDGNLITGPLGEPRSRDELGSLVQSKRLTHVGLDEVAKPGDVNRRLALLGARFMLETPARELADRLQAVDPPPGRQEVVRVNERRIILDVAHTPSAVSAVVDRITKDTTSGERYLLYGSLRGKRTGPILNELQSAFDRARVTLTEPDSDRSLPVDQLAEQWTSTNNAVPSTNSNPVTAFESLLDQSKPGDTLLVAGSFDLTGIIREQIYP